MSLANLSPTEREVLTRFVEATRALCGPRLMELRAYGSRVRGEGNEDSDLDVFVLLDHHDRRLERQVDNLAADLGLETCIMLDPRIWDTEEWRIWCRHERALAQAIAREGVPL